MIALLPLLVLTATPCPQQGPPEAEPAPTAPEQQGPASVVDPKASVSKGKFAARIQWFGTLEQGLAEAKRTNRPLLMTAAAPMCRGIAGMW